MSSLDELFSLHSMGFRGEALASIAAAARVTLSTKEPLAEKGTCVRYEGGKFISCEPIGMPSGTTVEVRDLFYNLPARFKFLKKDQTEANYIQVLIERFILWKTVLQSPGNCDPSSALYSVYGKEICSACRPINSTIDGITVKGFVGLPKIARASRSEQIIFVNQRLIRSKTITSAIDSAYTNMLMKGKYAFVILDILIPSADLDVNVHPQKAEVRFSNESMIYRAVYHAIVNTLSAETMSVEFEFNKGDNQKETNNAAPLQAPVPTAAKSEITVAAEQKPEVSDRPSPAVSVPESTPVSKPSVDYSKNIGYSNLYFKQQEKAYNVAETVSAPVIGIKEPAVQSEVKPEILPEAKQEPDPAVENILDMVPQSREESLHELTSSRVIGTLFDTYILLETKDRTLLMIDQHAAHEKVLYEQLVAQELEKKVVSQPLISPVIVSMSRSDISFIEEHSKDLEDIGFEVSSMGDSELAIRSVPAQVDPQSVSSAFIEMVDEWMHESKTRKDALILSLATSACKAAVKGHDKLHDIEIKRLLEDLSVLKDPYHCPHGRPILIRLPEKEIEKEFKRIV